MQDAMRWEFIYDKINGISEADVCEWVQDESTMEGALGPLIEQIYEVRNRLCERLGVDPASDPDSEQLMCAVEAFSRICGKLMYRYGYQDGVNLG